MYPNWNTHVNPDGALRNESSFTAMFQLCCDQTQHILATPKEADTRSIIHIGLSLVEALLQIVSETLQKELQETSTKASCWSPFPSPVWGFKKQA